MPRRILHLFPSPIIVPLLMGKMVLREMPVPKQSADRPAAPGATPLTNTPNSCPLHRSIHDDSTCCDGSKQAHWPGRVAGPRGESGPPSAGVPTALLVSGLAGQKGRTDWAELPRAADERAVMRGKQRDSRAREWEGGRRGGMGANRRPTPRPINGPIGGCGSGLCC